MGKQLAAASLWGVVGYLVGAFGGGFLISVLSPNTHDRSVEAAMTGAFVLGPVVAMVAFITGFARAGATRKKKAAARPPPRS